MRVKSHEERDTAIMAVRFAVGAQGSRYRKPSPDRCVLRQVTASIPTISRYFPPFPGKKSYESVLAYRQPFTAGLTTSAVSRKKRTHAEKGGRSGLHKRGNFLSCVDTIAVSVAGVLPSEYNGRTVAAEGICI